MLCGIISTVSSPVSQAHFSRCLLRLPPARQCRLATTPSSVGLSAGKPCLDLTSSCVQSCLPCIHVREKAVKGSTSFSEELSKCRPPPKSKAFVAIGPLVKRMGTALQGLCLARTARSSLATQVHVEVHSQRQAVDSVRILFDKLPNPHMKWSVMPVLQGLTLRM